MRRPTPRPRAFGATHIRLISPNPSTFTFKGAASDRLPARYAYRVGSVVVEEIVGHWDRYADAIPSDSAID